MISSNRSAPTPSTMVSIAARRSHHTLNNSRGVFALMLFITRLLPSAMKSDLFIFLRRNEQP